ncbi:MAG: flagellar motor protein MotD [Dechloromonas sp.]|jgi:chemotaxis protein MotB|uniref:Flagellar motor protein MotD n=1 Tax=Azonexus hydrophilus TaxID=418702 RepID=A0ABZ2XGC9_9RHOO|nr:flagellar motor protein MotD [Azonexus hydrophilus]MBS4016635.1 flagellar motor protein MotD [Dechloromonas sp.]MCA1937776.1 flagellar motor protein MotD [Dechloromonas sp.]
MGRRRRREEEHENHERWLVSYADFITLLFAFFVVMYAISSVNEGKYKVLSNSLVNAFKNTTGEVGGQPMTIIQGAPIMPPKPVTKPDRQAPSKADEVRGVQREQMRNVAGDILQALQPLVAQGKVRVLETSRGVTIEINDSILFALGQASLQTESISALRAVAAVLADSDFPITIEGHTDNVPIATPQFPSNWELSAMRATTVLRLFNDSGVGAERLTAIGYGETRPVETNTSVEGRARNRRVSILIDSNRPEEPTELISKPLSQ